jgi:hypothetical protein
MTTAVLVESVKQFSCYHDLKVDSKSRLTIPAQYRDVIIARNAVNIVHGLFDGTFTLSEDSISYEGEPILKFSRALQSKEIKTKPRNIESLFDLAEIDSDVCIGVTVEDEVRAYALSDWARIRDKGSQFKFFGQYEIDDWGRIQLDNFMKRKFPIGQHVGMYGMWKYFVLREPLETVQ